MRVLVVVGLVWGWLIGGAEAEPLRVGVSAPLSGVLAEFGVAVRNGILLAQSSDVMVKQNLQIVFEDSQWDPKTAVAAYHTLVNRHKVQIVYNWGNPTSEAVIPIAERAGVPLIAMSSDPKVGKGKKWIIRSVVSADQLGRLLGDFLWRDGVRKVGVVLTENSYVQGLYDGLDQRFTEYGGSASIAMSYPLSQNDFRDSLSRVKSGRFDAVGVFLITGQLSTFYRQMTAAKIQVKTFGADFIGSRREIEAAGPGIEGAVYPDVGVTQSFRAKYVEKFGNDTQIAFAANAFDVIRVLSKQFGSTISPTEILDRLKKTELTEGESAHGWFKFREDPGEGQHFSSPIIIRKVVNGDLVDQP